MARSTTLTGRLRPPPPDERLGEHAGDELLAACRARFPSPAYEVWCDERRTTWVKHRDGRRSVGLNQWLLREHSLGELLQHAEERLREPTPSG